MKELFRTTFKNGLTAVVSFDAENLDNSYVVEANDGMYVLKYTTNSPTAAFGMLAEIQRMEVEQ